MNFTFVDWIAIGIIALLAIKAMSKGFVREFSSKAGILLGLLAALIFSDPALQVLADAGVDIPRPVQGIIVFLLLFMAGTLAMRFFMSGIDRIIDVLRLNFLDYILGFLFGAAEGVIVVSALAYLLQLQTVIPTEVIASSQIVHIFSPIVPVGIDMIRNEFTNTGEVLHEDTSY